MRRLFVPYRHGFHQPHTLHLSQHRDIRQAFPSGVSMQSPVLRIPDILVRIRIRRSAIFISNLQDASKFLCLLLFEGTFTSFYKDKSHKMSQNRRNQGFSYYFCFMMEGSGSGFVPLSNGSGSRRSKNIRMATLLVGFFLINTDKLPWSNVHAIFLCKAGCRMDKTTIIVEHEMNIEQASNSTYWWFKSYSNKKRHS